MRQIETVAVVGAGTMGSGIIQVAATGGMRVLAYDARPEAAAKAKATIQGFLDRAVEKGRMSATDAAAAVERISVVDGLEGLAEADLVVEAIVEDLAVKQALFTDLERVTAADAILASNTSSLPITAIAAACERPERVAGLHFFNPVPLMRLVEVIPGLKTAPDVVDALVDVGARMGREPVRCADSPGFLVNHLGRGYMPEALRVLSEGIADAAGIDRIMTGAPGFRMGPISLVDLVGADVASPVMEAIFQQYYGEPAYQPSQILALRRQGGILGRKSGAGFYDYADGRKIEPEPALAPDARPAQVWVAGDAAGIAALRAVAEGAGVAVETGDAPSADALVVTAPVGTALSSLVAERGLDPSRTVAVDTLFGLEGPRTLMLTPATSAAARAEAHGLLGADGTTVVAVNDSPGFVAQRLVAMIVNVACHMAQRGVAGPADIDKGAKLGLNYPMGPFELAERLGPERILAILEALTRFYGEPRYRPSAWLERRVALGLPLTTPDPAV